jgi:hypothetical protein
MLRTSYYSLLHEIIFCPVHIFFCQIAMYTLDRNLPQCGSFKNLKTTIIVIVGIISIHT